MLMIFAKDGLVPEGTKEEIVQDLDELCRMITSLSRSLKSKQKET
jgi:hypothetical protein